MPVEESGERFLVLSCLIYAYRALLSSRILSVWHCQRSVCASICLKDF
jgi:hypothetical protein